MSAPLTAYKPSEWGLKFHRLDHDEALGAGSAGPGKSLVLLHDADTQIITEEERANNPKHPYHHGKGGSTGWALHLRRTGPMLELSVQRSLRVFPVLVPGAVWKESKLTWEFPSGYRYQFGHCHETNDWMRYLSFEYTWIGFDELVQFTEEQYDQIITRCRSSDPVLGKMLKVRSVSNPVMRREANENFTIHDPHWVRKRFVEPHRDGNMTLKRRLEMDDGTVEWWRWIYLPARLTDNPDPAFRRTYEKGLQNSPPHIRQALLRGDWFVTADSYFAHVWNPNVHVCDHFKIPEDWPKFRSMDWGFKSFGCIHWYAVSPENQLFVFKELTFKGKTADVVAGLVKEIEQELGIWKKGRTKSPITGPADTQLWEQRGVKAKPMAQEFLDRGIMWLKADKKSRFTNAMRLTKLLDTDQGMRDPGIVIFKGCTRLVETLPAVQTSPSSPDEPADGGEDHWVDSAFYGAAHFSRGRAVVSTLRDEDDDYEQEQVGSRDRGRYGYGSPVC